MTALSVSHMFASVPMSVSVSVSVTVSVSVSVSVTVSVTVCPGQGFKMDAVIYKDRYRYI